MIADIFAHMWPLGIVVMFLTAPFVVFFFERRKHKKWLKANPAPNYPDGAIERIARAMCRADGRNPDSDGSIRMRETDGSPGKFTWMLYSDRARHFLAATNVLIDLVEEYQITQSAPASVPAASSDVAP